MTPNPLTVAVLGAGTMGSGIAVVAARAGHRTILLDITDEDVQRGIDTVEASSTRASRSASSPRTRPTPPWPTSPAPSS